MHKQSVEVTLNKRKRGFIRKAIELSELCKQEIHLTFYDRSTGTLVSYQSHAQMGTVAFQELRENPHITKESYVSEDYEALAPKYITKKIMARFRQRGSEPIKKHILIKELETESESGSVEKPIKIERPIS